MNVLLINPPIYDFSVHDLWMKPLGFLYLSDLLKKNECEVSYFDFMDRGGPLYDKIKDKDVHGCGKFYNKLVTKPEIYKDVPRKYKRFGLPMERFVEYLDTVPEIDFIFITSGMTYWYQGVIEVINFCKKRFKNIPIILGGNYTTFCFTHSKNIGADFVFTGKDLKKFCYEFNDFFSTNLKYYDNLSPDWNLYKKLSYLCVKISSGCPFHCYYCGIKKIEPDYLLWDLEKIVEDLLKKIEKFNVKDIAFYDDALLFNFDKHLSRFFKHFSYKKEELKFHTPNGLHSKFVDKDMSEFLKENRFKTLRLSVESVFSFREAESDYKTTFAQFENALNNLLNAGFKKEDIGVYLLIGLPEQKPEEVVKSIKILKNYSCKIKLAEYSPIPGTVFYEKSLKMYPHLPLSDPLFQNNSIFPLWQFKDKWSIINYIKQLAKD